MNGPSMPPGKSLSFTLSHRFSQQPVSCLLAQPWQKQWLQNGLKKKQSKKQESLNHHWQTQGPFLSLIYHQVFIEYVPQQLAKITAQTSDNKSCFVKSCWPEKADLPLSQNSDSLIPCGLKATYSDTVGWNFVPVKLQWHADSLWRT